eukprot:CAMPEP_0185754624 /NCGR_PEP_ID=MMETSP1174-20130828/13250_1 /TAXON_ID=35687 /ORGANISM="Dictyocha speculum, Strain CCMP1381" /LENGTH=64 /DNA_ID=CAMNT_0028432913 /DNA_START=1 /DNA_END=191 /DNA_ORIENTATION=+
MGGIFGGSGNGAEVSSAENAHPKKHFVERGNGNDHIGNMLGGSGNDAVVSSVEKAHPKKHFVTR